MFGWCSWELMETQLGKWDGVAVLLHEEYRAAHQLQPSPPSPHAPAKVAPLHPADTPHIVLMKCTALFDKAQGLLRPPVRLETWIFRGNIPLVRYPTPTQRLIIIYSLYWRDVSYHLITGLRKHLYISSSNLGVLTVQYRTNLILFISQE